MKVVYILRAASGSGKSTLAKELAGGYEKAEICEADMYFMNNGKYQFDATKLGAAHAWCRSAFERALNDPDCDCIIISNTNTKNGDFAYYENESRRRGHMVFVLVVENRHGGKDIHNVPAATVEKQKENIKNSLKL